MSAPSGHWASIAESGSVLGIRLMVIAYRIGGRSLFRLFLFPVMVFYFLWKRDARVASQDFLARVNRLADASVMTGWWSSYRHFWQFGNALIDKFAVWMGHITREDVCVYNGELIDDLLLRGQGAIICVSHLGNFEVCQSLSQTRSGLKLTVLHHTRNAEKFNRLLKQFNANSAVTLQEVTNVSTATAITFSEKIQAGEFIAIACDRVPVNNPGGVIDMPFLGEPASFPRGPFALSMALGAPVLFVACIKQAGAYHIHFETLSEGGQVPRREREQHLAQLARRYSERLQHYCLQVPLQWFNFYDFWRNTDAVAGGQHAQKTGAD